MRTTLLFALFCLFSIFSEAQLITRQNGKCGLLTESGKQVLPTVYDNIEPLGTFKEIFVYYKNQKLGLYDFSDSTLYPCEYDDITGREDKRIIRKGKMYGYIARNYMGDGKYVHKIIVPQYTYARFITDRTISLRKDSLYGLLKADTSLTIKIPFELKLPVDYTEYWKYYSWDNADSVTLYYLADKPGTYAKMVVPRKNSRIMDSVIINKNYNAHTLQIWNYHTGEKSELFVATDPLHQSFYYDTDCSCVRESNYVPGEKLPKIITEKFRNPYSHYTYAEFSYSNKQKLFVGAGDNEDSPETREVYLHSVTRTTQTFTYLGKLEGYTYTEYTQPRIVSKPYDRSHGGNGKKPFFMPGKD